MCNLSPISLQIAPLWIRLISTLWFNMVIQPAALASHGVKLSFSLSQGNARSPIAFPRKFNYSDKT